MVGSFRLFVLLFSIDFLFGIVLVVGYSGWYRRVFWEEFVLREFIFFYSFSRSLRIDSLFYCVDLFELVLVEVGRGFLRVRLERVFIFCCGGKGGFLIMWIGYGGEMVFLRKCGYG